jgi:hypothetical protein
VRAITPIDCLVYFDEGPKWPARVIGRWNGWGVPSVTLEVRDAIIAWLEPQLCSDHDGTDPCVEMRELLPDAEGRYTIDLGLTFNDTATQAQIFAERTGYVRPESSSASEPASADLDVLEEAIHKHALSILTAHASADADAWTDAVSDLDVADPAALLRAMPEHATRVGIADANEGDSLDDVARWAFAHYVCDAMRLAPGLYGPATVVTAKCATCGELLSWEYPGAWHHANVDLETEHYAVAREHFDDAT